ncbi:helix-turn-helix transcriptional regulator [Salarchaeum sp. JOR-1]|uniref:DUF7344 domain-containing protein n=1 Tax=Salarchaeum sp. JOR-1 TaxID=2599399 RepID=UPI0011986F4D|nr:helix-turn-helix transcriptional regulator [Salarchaeum sp. JOR-1]QDX41777.1 helix-turn-helix transcriptional regulator [Salarchaeum sp. JOR-1]
MTANESSRPEWQNVVSPDTDRCIDPAALAAIDQSASEIFALYTSAHRRAVIRYLAANLDTDETITARELATEVTACLTDTAPENVSGDDRRSVYVGLYQLHLDKLEAANVITRTEEGITTTPTTATVATVLALVETLCNTSKSATPMDGDAA